MKITRFLGHECVSLANESLTLLITTSLGPRILALKFRTDENLFAELPGLTLDYPRGGAYSLHGGHRLWYAPEMPERTYLPDDQPVEIGQLDGGLRVTQPAEPQTGLQKSLHIRLPDQGATVIIDHRLTNQGKQPLSCAPWAISMFKPGGVAILPQNLGPADSDGVLPNRNLVLWPYADMRNQHVTWGNRYIFIRAAFQSGAFKVAFANPRGWLAYHRRNALFVKYAEHQEGAPYYDMGGSSQCYCHPRFLELETLGPKANLDVGQTVTHREVWRVFDLEDFTPSEDAVHEIVTEMHIENNPL